MGKSQKCTHRLCEWSCAYVKDPKDLPINPYGTWNVSMLVSDEDLVQDIALHLQSLGQYISAQDIVHYLDTPKMKTHLGLKKTISHKTAARWIHIMGYWWGEELKGQYADGHERDNVVTYWQSIFLPAWAVLEAKTGKFDNDGSLDALAPLPTCPTLQWIHSSKTAKPYAKEPDGSGPGARVLLRPSKEHDGYFTCDGVLAQATKAMDLLDQYYPNEDHVFIYDNVTTHKKQAEDALSARHMLKYPPKRIGKGKNTVENWGLKVPLIDTNGKAVHGPDGKVIKIFTKMVDAKFADGTPQPLYFPNNHPRHPGLFKGMEVILEEHGFHNVKSLKPECKGFKCKPTATDCCCHHILFNQPDFTNVKSLLEDLCESQGYTVIFLPKFHPELNFIEMCWGYGKQVYCQYPISSDPSVLEKNALMALESVPLLSMRWFSNWSLRFMDGYRCGLNGLEAVWATKKYHGHRCLPPEMEHDIDSEYRGFQM
ncbi:hypothetical protein BS47DRAFT_1374494 [Hydnum rufescens UP504]|uniref:Uncharacterized protein n=1 Tax=Hydnum rufescens UP504 TaxID=1448309 RepID=A0A9P6ADW1_9AGAM|nr:hypothetical protein BS47DRAFT_1374494 [Hydnum rufescens UP504]